MMKVIQFIENLNRGGAETLVKQYGLIMNNLVELTVVCIHNSGSSYDVELREKGVHVIYIDDIITEMRKLKLIPQKVLSRILRSIVLKKVIVDNAPDILHFHLHTAHYLQGISLPENTKLVYTVHSEPTHLWGGIKGKRDFSCLRRLDNLYEVHFIALHESMKKKVDELFCKTDTQIFNNGVDLSTFVCAGNKDELKCRYDIDKKPIVIGYVAGFHKSKNHVFLLKIGEILKQRNVDFQIWFIGDGSCRQMLELETERLHLERNVVFWGIRDDVPKILKMFDIAVIPSLFEGLSIAIVEAQVAGIKCLISDTVSEYTKISNLVEFYDLNEGASNWADKIQQMVKEALQPVYYNLELWDINKIVDKMIIYYGKL